MARLIRPIRQLSPHLCNLRQLSSPKLPSSSIVTPLLLFPSFSTVTSPRRRRTEALAPAVVIDTDEPESDDAGRSRNQRKRDAKRAVRFGMELPCFSSEQIKKILRAASLGEEVYDALLLAKKLGPDVREGKRRHFNYIGKMLREVEPDLMDTLINATKQGDQAKLQALISEAKEVADVVDIETDSEDEVGSSEEEEEYIATAARWFDGLISQNTEITKEVYSLRSVDFDRQELRKLVREVQLVHEKRKRGIAKEKQKEVDAALATAEKSLNRLLCSMAKQMQSAETDLYL